MIYFRQVQRWTVRVWKQDGFQVMYLLYISSGVKTRLHLMKYTIST